MHHGYGGEEPESHSVSEEVEHDDYEATDGDDESDDSDYSPRKREGPLIVTLKVEGGKLSEIANGQRKYDYQSRLSQQNGASTITKEWKADVVAPDAMDIDKHDSSTQTEQTVKENAAPKAHDISATPAAALEVQETG